VDSPRKLSSTEFEAVGFVPGYVKFDAADCMRLNSILERRLMKHEPESDEWWSAAKEVHENAKMYLRVYSDETLDQL